MSISLIVLSPKREIFEKINVPIATEAVFKKIWLPISQLIHAQWIPLFQTGVDVSGDDFSDVSKELTTFSNCLENSDYPKEEIAMISKRIHTLLESLRDLQEKTEGNVTVFIG